MSEQDAAAVDELLAVIEETRKAELAQNELPIGWHVRIYDAARALKLELPPVGSSADAEKRGAQLTEAARQPRESPAASAWATKRPPEPGLYWCKRDGNTMPVMVCRDSAGLTGLVPGVVESVDLFDAGFEWSGPLRPPEP